MTLAKAHSQQAIGQNIKRCVKGSSSHIVARIPNQDGTVRMVRGELLSESNGIATVKLMNRFKAITLPIDQISSVTRPGESLR